MKPNGKFIVIYGINNLGKSTQVKLLVSALQSADHAAEYLKYPVYDLPPTGPKLNAILRGGNGQNITELDLQQLYAQNRFDYQPTLKAKLADGITIVAEDYIGTGLAWGITKGAQQAELERQNAGLIKEDVAILLDGQRFLEAKESGHLHEQNDDLVNRCRQVHLDLAKRYGWTVISANRPIEEIQKDIRQIITEKFPNFPIAA